MNGLKEFMSRVIEQSDMLPEEMQGLEIPEEYYDDIINEMGGDAIASLPGYAQLFDEMDPSLVGTVTLMVSWEIRLFFVCLALALPAQS